MQWLNRLLRARRPRGTKRHESRSLAIQRLEHRWNPAGVLPLASWTFEDIDISALESNSNFAPPAFISDGVPQDFGVASSAIEFQRGANQAYSAKFDESSSISGISYWLRPDSTISAATSTEVTHQFATQEGDFEIVLGGFSPSLDGEVLTLVSQQLDGGFTATSVVATSLEADRWTHVAWAWNATAGHYDAYLDGSLQMVVANSRAHAGRLTTSDFLLGRRNDSISLSYSGAIDELNFYTDALTAADVAGLSPWRGPTFAWDLDNSLGTGVSPRNASALQSVASASSTDNRLTATTRGDVSTVHLAIRPDDDIVADSQPLVLAELQTAEQRFLVTAGAWSPSVENEVLTLVELLPGGGARMTAATDIVLTANTVSHVFLAWDDSISAYQFYVNGSAVQTTENSRGHSRQIVGNDRVVLQPKVFSEAQDSVTVDIDHVALFPHVDQADVQLLTDYLEQRWSTAGPVTLASWTFDAVETDLAESNFAPPTHISDGVPQDFGVAGSAIEFHRDANQAFFAEFDETSSIQGISYWLRPDSDVTALSPTEVTHRLAAQDGDFELVLGRFSPSLDGEVITLVSHHPNGGFSATSVVGTEISGNRWTHIAWVWNAMKHRYDAFLDGILQAVVPNTRAHSGNITASGFSLGRRSDVAPLAYSGDVDELIFYSKLSPDDIAAIARWRGPTFAWDLDNSLGRRLLSTRDSAMLQVAGAISADDRLNAEIRGDVNTLHLAINPDAEVTSESNAIVLAEFQTAEQRFLVTAGGWSRSVDNEVLTLVELLPGGGARMTAATGIVLPANRTSHIVLAWNDSTSAYQFFLNGIAVETTENSRGHSRRIVAADHVFLQHRIPGEPQDSIEISVDHVAIYPHVDASDVALFSSKFEDPNWRFAWTFDDHSSLSLVSELKGHEASLQIDSPDIESQWQMGVNAESNNAPSRSLMLDGRNRRYVADSFAVSPLTALSFWFAPSENLSSSTANRRIMHFEGPHGEQLDVQIGSYSPSIPRASITLIQIVPNTFKATTVTDLVWPAGMWHHVAFSWNESLARYDVTIDGELRSVATNGSGHVQLLQVNHLELGGSGADRGDAFTGFLDELIIWDSLAPQQMASRTVNNFTNVALISNPVVLTVTNAGSVGVPLDAIDANGDDYYFTLETEPQHGAVLWDAENDAFTYFPDLGFEGVESLLARVHDDQSSGASFVIELQIEQPTFPMLSYFVPGQGTIDVEEGDPGQASLSGQALPADIVVNSQLGKLIERLDRNGESVWRYQQPTQSRSIDYHDGEVFYTTNTEVQVLNGATGVLDRRIQLPSDTGYVLFANVLEDHSMLIGRRRVNGNYSVDQVTSTGELIQSWFYAEVFAPRWADRAGDRLVVADTFNHQVILLNIATDERVDIPVYFPNDVRLVEERILITEEHADRVWWYDVQTETRELVISGPGERSNLSLSLSEIIALANSPDSRIQPANDRSKSVSAVEYAGPRTLYSPNGAVAVGNAYLIADTDNHRVLHVGANGEVLSIVGTFNNPTKVMPVD